MIKSLNRVLIVAGALGFILGIVFKLIYIFSRTYVLNTTPSALFQFTAICCLASIALSLIEISGKIR